MDKELQIEEIAREIAKRSCHLFESCPKPIKHNCISQDPEIMLESSKNYITIATWLVEEGYHKTIWHKVADGDLPENHKRILLEIKKEYFNDEGYIVRQVVGSRHIFDNKVEWWTDTDDRNFEVIAWTELPAYKE